MRPSYCSLTTFILPFSVQKCVYALSLTCELKNCYILTSIILFLFSLMKSVLHQQYYFLLFYNYPQGVCINVQTLLHFFLQLKLWTAGLFAKYCNLDRDKEHLWAWPFKTCHNFFVGFKSLVWLDHSNTNMSSPCCLPYHSFEFWIMVLSSAF